MWHTPPEVFRLRFIWSKVLLVLMFVAVSIHSGLAEGQPVDVSYWTEQDWKRHFASKSNIKPLEGIWSYNYNWARQSGYTGTEQDSARYAVVPGKRDDGYLLFQITQEPPTHRYFWETTSRANHIIVHLTGFVDDRPERTIRINALLTNGVLEYSYTTPRGILGPGGTFKEATWVKIFAPHASGGTESRSVAKTGSGFLVSSAGYVVTNEHVVDGANSITIRGIGGDYNSAKSANVVAVDKANDLALLKFDPSGMTVGRPRYGIDTKLQRVGEDVFVLGYPLTASMGKEIKLTTGIVSALTGFGGSAGQYQVSAPVQPGNSGGPLLGPCGNVIGVASAKHVEADNATYAVKSLFVQNLLATAGVQMPVASKEACGASLPTKVQRVKGTVYIIDVR
jgi:S1-C subfamily serine protease